MKVWKGVRPNQDADARLAKLIRAEKNDRLIELSALNTRIQSLQEKNRNLTDENQGYKEAIELAFKKPVEVEIAGLQTERERVQDQIQNLDEQIESFQREINGCESEIEDLVNRKHKKALDITKLEAQAHEFISGWCDYILQSKTHLPDTISNQITDVQHLAQDTLQSYIASL